MPEANLSTFSLEDKSPQELETERRSIIATMTTKYKGYEDPEVPREMLQRLAIITAALRRKNSGPPKAAKPKAANGSKKSLDDVLGML